MIHLIVVMSRKNTHGFTVVEVSVSLVVATAMVIGFMAYFGFYL